MHTPRTYDVARPKQNTTLTMRVRCSHVNCCFKYLNLHNFRLQVTSHWLSKKNGDGTCKVLCSTFIRSNYSWRIFHTLKKHCSCIPEILEISINTPETTIWLGKLIGISAVLSLCWISERWVFVIVVTMFITLGVSQEYSAFYLSLLIIFQGHKWAKLDSRRHMNIH